ncbi:MAG: alpha-amylase family glycosyl hydrolase [Butyricicoccaceae bacterium]
MCCTRTGTIFRYTCRMSTAKSNNDFFGGTLRGVYAKLDYLESLHITTIYFNPIFQAYSNHRYDTGDYKRIDPLLGCEEDFRALCSEAARRGMRVVLDGVFNHTGYDSRYFNARGHYDSVGAFQSKESPYFSWFDFHNWPNEYGSWWGIYTLPQVNESDGSYQDYIIEDEDSVVRRWLRLGASGWRLDVADELPDSFIQKLNAAARREKSDALIIGEVRCGRMRLTKLRTPSVGAISRAANWIPS